MNSLFKRLLTALLAASVAIGTLAACGKKEDGKVEDSSILTDSNASEESDEVSESFDISEESSKAESSEDVLYEDSTNDDSSEEGDHRPQKPDGQRPDRPDGGKPSDGNDALYPLPDDSDIVANEIDSFFDNSVFIGYSIMMHFGRYVGEWRTYVDPSIMGNSLFCAGVGMGFNADRKQTPDMPDNSLPLFQGQSYNFADLPGATGCDTLYIGLPGYSDLKRAMDDASCVYLAFNEAMMGIERIRAKNPDLNIVILSCTYNTEVYKGLTRARCSNAKVLEYNNLVLDYCTENGIDFIDVSTMLTDSKGLMVMDYTTDGEYHIVKNAYYLWIEALRDYAAKKQNCTWENIKDMPNLPATAE